MKINKIIWAVPERSRLRRRTFSAPEVKGATTCNSGTTTTHDFEITAVVLHALANFGRIRRRHHGTAFGCISLRNNALSVRTMQLRLGVARIRGTSSSAVRQTKVNGGHFGAVQRQPSH